MSISDFTVCLLIAVATVAVINLAIAAVRDHENSSKYEYHRQDIHQQERKAA